MADTGAQLTTKVRYNLGDRDDKDVIILVAINSAIQRIGAMFKWPNLQQTVSGTLGAETETMTVPEFTKTIISAWYEIEERSYFIEPTTAFRNDRNTKGRVYYGITEHIYEGESRPIFTYNYGHPRTWFKFGNAIHFYPIPAEDTTIWLRVIMKPISIDENTEHDLGDDMDRLIVLFATSEMYSSLGIHDDAGAWEGRAIQAFRERKQSENVVAWTPKTAVDGIPLHI